ncbi:HNH endonuclease [Calothrix sp. PCC 6303]|nr:HNH endonuclease [Calothrix sp. PCC 6303]
MDKFRVEVLSKTPNPQQVIYAAMHQDYTGAFVYDERDRFPSEEQCGDIIVKRLLAGDRGHYGCTEHPQIVFNCGYFPHSVMQQARTHRTGVSFDVQCLAANTEITFVDYKHQASSKLNKTIGELYELWTNGESAIRQRLIKGRNGELPGEYRRDSKTRIRKMRLRVLNEETGLFEVGHIKDVMCSGMQPVYRVTLEDGKTIDCTAKHRLFTSEGWQTMGDAVGLLVNLDHSVSKITKSCHVMCNGVAVVDDKKRKPWNYDPNALYRNQVWLEEQLSKGLHADEMAQLANCSVEAIKKWVYAYGLSLNKKPKGTKNPWNKKKRGYKLQLSEESRVIRVENAKKYTRRGEESNFWKGGTSTERELIGAWTRDTAPQVHKKFNYICQRCGNMGGNLHAHHLIPVFADESVAYEFDNLVTVCKQCHEHIHHNNLEAEFAQSFQPIIEPANWNEKPKPPGRKLKAHPVKVKSVEYLGEQMTYDLEVDGSWHNFVANGMVVHNSYRYTSQQVIDVIEAGKDIEEVFYLRPIGNYSDRQGKKYYYSPEQRQKDLEWCLEAAKRYKDDIDGGMSEEHARGKVPFDYRQHFVVSFNMRSLLHFLDLRYKKDAQLEIQKLCELMFPHLEEWTPAIAAWYKSTRMGKARLSP